MFDRPSVSVGDNFLYVAVNVLVALRFRTVVVDAYIDGRNRLTQLAQPAPAAATRGGGRRG